MKKFSTGEKMEKDSTGRGRIVMSSPPPIKAPARLVNVDKVVMVASGKGGVGKSTVAVNIAVALAGMGKRVGLLDADIYGPSVPLMTGTGGNKPGQSVDGGIIPVNVQVECGDDGRNDVSALQVMSIGFMVDDRQALIWRGPMVHKALYQLVNDVEWGSKGKPLDILLIDMPPGTGDVQITLAQKVKTDGAIIVSTPQDIALLDAGRAVEMFGRVGVDILGVVENMSVYVCLNCGHEEHIFSGGGAEKIAGEMGVEFLGGVPLDIGIRQRADAGRLLFGGGEDMQAFARIAKKVTGILWK